MHQLVLIDFTICMGWEYPDKSKHNLNIIFSQLNQIIFITAYHISQRFFRVFELRHAENLEFLCLCSIFIIYAVFAMFFSFIFVRQNNIFFKKVYKVRVLCFLFKYIHCIVYNAITNTNWNCCWFYLYVYSVFYLFFLFFFLQCGFLLFHLKLKV